MNHSAIRVLMALELFAEADTPLTISDVSARLQIPKTSAFDIVNILAERRYILRDNDRAKTYVIGPKAYQVGRAYLEKNDLYSLVHPSLVAMKEKIGETCYLAIEESGSLFYLDKVESDSPIRASRAVGSRNYLHCTGLGKAILAGYPAERVEKIIAQGLPYCTENTITTPSGLHGELERIRKRGYSIDNGEDNPYIRCVAAPIRNDSGEVIAAISISMLSAAFTEEHSADAVDIVCREALLLSHRIGYRGEKLYADRAEGIDTEKVEDHV